MDSAGILESERDKFHFAARKNTGILWSQRGGRGPLPNVQVFDRVVLAVDVQGFSKQVGRMRDLIAGALDQMLTEAASAVGLDREQWDERPEGDGMVAVLPADVDLLRVVRKFVTELDLVLADHNESHAPAARIRLRVAMHAGSVTFGGKLGWGGDALIDLARLLDSQPLRRALDEAAGANLAQIISESLFGRVVVLELGGLRRSQFSKATVDIPAKGFRQDGYLYVPVGRAQPPPAEPPPAPPPRPVPPEPPWLLDLIQHVEPLAEDTLVVQVRPQPPQEAERPASPPPAEYGTSVKALLADLRAAMRAGDHVRADGLTTEVLLAAAGRGKEGWLRTRDAAAPLLPDVLLTDLDDIWASASQEAWGFAEQRKRLAGADRVKFSALLEELGWEAPGDVLPPRYAVFVARASRERPFFPTLRSPGREGDRDDSWREEWQMTAVAVHTRLQTWA